MPPKKPIKTSNYISTEGLDDEDESSSSSSDGYNVMTVAGMGKFLVFLFILFMMIISDAGVRILTKIPTATSDGYPTFKGRLIQGVALSVVTVLILFLLTSNII